MPFNTSACPAGVRRPMLGPNEMDGLFNALAQRADLKPRVLSADPWVLQFDSWTSIAEARALADGSPSFQPDITGSALQSTRNAKYRNSSSYACDLRHRCASNPAFARHAARMEQLLGVPLRHGDGIHVLKYHPGGFYRRHHDYVLGDTLSWLHCGPRQLTFMLYLSSLPDDGGGGTSFFHLGINVKPVAGRAVLWANTFPEAPLRKDERTAHEALTVLRGIKYSATTWLHAHDIASNKANRCCPPPGRPPATMPAELKASWDQRVPYARQRRAARRGTARGRPKRRGRATGWRWSRPGRESRRERG